MTRVTYLLQEESSISTCLYANIQLIKKGDLFVETTFTETPATPQAKRLNLFERYLTLWVALCMIIGVALGKTIPGFVQSLRSLEFGQGSHVNVPIAILIWLMIIPMMMKVDFASILSVREKPRGLLVTLFVNWLVKPFSMALISWVFFRHIFSAWIPGPLADQYIAGTIILAAAPCTAMVFVWSYLTDGDPAYTLVQVSVNDLIMLFLFAPIVRFLVSGASSLQVPFNVLLYSVFIFIVIPLGGGFCASILVHTQARCGMVRTKPAAEICAGHNPSPARHPGFHLCLSGRQHHQPLFSRDSHCHPDSAAGVFQFRFDLRPDEALSGSAFRGCTRRIDRCKQLL